LLVKCARELDPNITSLTLLTEPGQWRNLVQAMKDAARWSREEQVFGAPSLAIKLGFTLLNVTNVE